MKPNPDKYDIVILGSGPGGHVAAIRASQLGAKVAIVEKGFLGGTCLNSGCIPTKVLIYSLNLYSKVKDSERLGLRIKDISIDYPKLFERKDQTVKRLRKGLEALLKQNKVELIKGEGTLERPGVVEIKPMQGTEYKIQASKIILATGSEPAKPPQFKIDGQSIITSNEILELKEIPKSIIIIGGGPIGCEFACTYSQLGCRVTIIELMPRILPEYDEEISQVLEAELKKSKVNILTNTKIEKIFKEDRGVTVSLKGVKEFRAEKVLVAVGRALNTKRFESAGLKLEGDKVAVNEKMETNLAGVYAIGDITRKNLSAHVASAQAMVAAENAMGKDSKLNYMAAPNCVYTSPQVASAGFTGKEAIEKGYKIKTGKFPFSASAKALIMTERVGWVKIVADEKTDRILGIHIIGPQATDLIAEASLAIERESTLEDLARTIHAHPTLAETLAEAARSAQGRAIYE